MKYLDEKSIQNLCINWKETITVIENSIQLLRQKKFSQPIKPYLRYNNPENRIIAMPAYIGGQYETAGIKWIASFPSNIESNVKRAHSVIILNEAHTGKPYCIINSGLISAIRTASVSGYIFDRYLNKLKGAKRNVGIIGFGPIGKLHLKMLANMNAGLVEKFYLYDIKGIDINEILEFENIEIGIANSWEEVYEKTNVLITCTVSSDRYINKIGNKGTLHLNVSLRDYCPEFMKSVDIMLVDDWEEVCRENTDIEYMYLNHGLQKSNVNELCEDFIDNKFTNLENKVVMFNPMGMAIFDMSISKYYYDLSNHKEEGIAL